MDAKQSSQIGLADQLLLAMGADNGCVFKPPAARMAALNAACNGVVMTPLELDIVTAGEYGEQLMLIAKRRADKARSTASNRRRGPAGVGASARGAVQQTSFLN
jgi:hypothetical protein